MSNLFENFDAGEPFDFNVSRFETDDQIHLRERFGSLTDRNTIELVCFDPNEYQSYRQIRLNNGEKEYELAEPQLTNILMLEMLRSINLEPPSSEDDSKFIIDRLYKNGGRSIVYTVEREDASHVPVYCETTTDGYTPKFMCLISYDRVRDTINHYRDLDEYGAKLSKKLKIGTRALDNLSVEELKGFTATFDDIQRL